MVSGLGLSVAGERNLALGDGSKSDILRFFGSVICFGKTNNMMVVILSRF